MHPNPTPRSLFPLSPAALAVRAVYGQPEPPARPLWYWPGYPVAPGRSTRVRFRGASTADDVLPIEVFTE